MNGTSSELEIMGKMSFSKNARLPDDSKIELVGSSGNNLALSRLDHPPALSIIDGDSGKNLCSLDGK